jgi:hypothetical protein
MTNGDKTGLVLQFPAGSNEVAHQHGIAQSAKVPVITRKSEQLSVRFG